MDYPLTVDQQQLINNQNIPAGQDGSPWTPPNTSTHVPTDQIMNGGGLSFSSNPPVDNGASLVAGVVAGVTPPEVSKTPALDQAGDYSKDPNVVKAQTTYDQSKSDLQSYNMPSQADEYTKLLESSGANADLAKVKQLKEQLASETATFNNEIAQTEAQGIKSGTPALYYQGIMAAKQRQAAIMLAGTAARLQAAQGNYELATKTVEKMIDLKYTDAQNKLNKINQSES